MQHRGRAGAAHRSRQMPAPAQQLSSARRGRRARAGRRVESRCATASTPTPKCWCCWIAATARRIAGNLTRCAVRRRAGRREAPHPGRTASPSSGGLADAHAVRRRAAGGRARPAASRTRSASSSASARWRPACVALLLAGRRRLSVPAPAGAPHRRASAAPPRRSRPATCAERVHPVRAATTSSRCWTHDINRMLDRIEAADGRRAPCLQHHRPQPAHAADARAGRGCARPSGPTPEALRAPAPPPSANSTS